MVPAIQELASILVGQRDRTGKGELREAVKPDHLGDHPVPNIVSRRL